MLDYRKIFIDLSNSLETNSLIEVLKNEIGNSVPENDYSYQLTFERFGIQLFEQLLAFYYSISDCTIEWQCDLNKHRHIKRFYPDDTIISGQMIIRSIHEMLNFDKKLEADWWTKNLEENEKADLYKFRSFDFNDDSIRTGFIIENNAIKEEDFFFITQGSEGFFPVNLSFNDYIKKWDLFKGYQGWQYNEFFKGTTQYKRMMHYLEQIFGDEVA